MSLGGIQPLRDHAEQRHALATRGILREPPADAGFAVLQAGVPSRPSAEQTGPPGAPVLFPEGILGTTTGAIVSRLWTRKRGGSCTRATSHGTSHGNRYFPRPRPQDRACPSHRLVPKRRTMCTSPRILPLLIRLPPRRCLRQITPYPRRDETSDHPTCPSFVLSINSIGSTDIIIWGRIPPLHTHHVRQTGNQSTMYDFKS